MARVGAEKQFVISEDHQALIQAFTNYLALEKGVLDNTEVSYATDIRIFFAYLESYNYSCIDFTQDDIKDFLAYRRTLDRNAASSLRRMESSIKSFVRFLRINNYRDDDPMKGVARPKKVKALPKIMSEQTVEAFLNVPDITTYVGLRDKAMFELLYACGLRVSELCELTFSNLHLDQNCLLIKGKGAKERIIPLTDAAVYWIGHYVTEQRSTLDPLLESPFVFLSQKASHGARSMTRQAFWYRVKVYSKQLLLESVPSPHSFRHAFATHLLNHDADLRVVQTLLGHSQLTTTEIYTHVALARMHEVYDKAMVDI